MIRTYICESCGATRDIWRQLSKNFPPTLECTCGGVARQDTHISSPSIVFKGKGWTPARHSTTAEVALEGDNDQVD